VRRAALACLFLLLALAPTSGAQSVHIRVLSRYHPREFEIHPSGANRMYIHFAGEDFVLEPHAAGSVARIEIDGDALRASIQGREIRARELIAIGPLAPCEFVLSVPGRVSRRYEGRLSIMAREGELAADVDMDLEVAVASAIQAESEPGTPLEALKAQAVVTRSYYFAAKARHGSDEFCDLTHCQVLREPPPRDSPAARAAQETLGIVLEYQDKPFAAMFTRSCGGRTRTPADTGLPANGYPYFAVVCDYCHTTPYRWIRKLTPEDAALLAKGEAGRLAVNRRLGWNTVPSNSFRTHAEGGQIVLEGTGQGHGIGYCQLGARGMAADGAKFREILLHYFPNTTLQSVRYSNP